jgi:hypothetical protein
VRCIGTYSRYKDGATLYMFKHLTLPPNILCRNKEAVWRQLKEQDLTIDRERQGKANEGVRALA